MIAATHKKTETKRASTSVGLVIRENMISRLKNGMEKHPSVFVVSYARLSSGRMDDFRKALKRAKAKVYVSRNSIARRALKDLSYEGLSEKIDGQTAFIFSDADSAEISKALTKYAKESQGALLVKGGVLQGEVLGKNDIERLAELPSKEILLITLLAVLQSPLFQLATVLSSKTQELVQLLKQLSEKENKS